MDGPAVAVLLQRPALQRHQGKELRGAVGRLKRGCTPGRCMRLHARLYGKGPNSRRRHCRVGRPGTAVQRVRQRPAPRRPCRACCACCACCICKLTCQPAGFGPWPAHAASGRALPAGGGAGGRSGVRLLRGEVARGHATPSTVPQVDAGEGSRRQPCMRFCLDYLLPHWGPCQLHAGCRQHAGRSAAQTALLGPCREAQLHLACLGLKPV